MQNKISEEKIKYILRKSNKPLDCEVIAKRLHSLRYINQIDSALNKFEKQGLIEAI